jgi:hypothetical protein
MDRAMLVTDQKERGHIAEIMHFADVLADAIAPTAEALGSPEWIEDGDNQRFRYRHPDAKVLQVLMCVRIASGLRAATFLLLNGHTSEVAVLLRTIHDFVGEIGFADEVLLAKEPTLTQQKFIAEFFEDQDVGPDWLISPPRGPSVSRRQKARASQGRQYAPDDPYEFISLSRAIGATFDRYVHGGYSASMELYHGGNHPGFDVRGTPRTTTFRFALAQAVQMALGVFSLVARNVGRDDLAETLRRESLAFGRSEASRSSEGAT